MYPGKVLRAGSSGADVSKIQQRLHDLGVRDATGKDLAVDGGFGPSTDAAVRLFQARSFDDSGQPLEVDGTVGPMTWAALFREAVTPAPVPAGNYLAEVINLARAQVGVMEDPLGSNRGPMVDEFLKRVGLNPVGHHYAWCAAFVYWCFDEAAVKTGKSNPAPKSAGVLETWQMAGQAKHLRYTPNQAANAPELIKPGFVFFLDTGQGNGHMGIVAGVAGTKLTTIEGNTTNVTGSREGIGVFERNARTIPQVNLGFADYTQQA